MSIRIHEIVHRGETKIFSRTVEQSLCSLENIKEAVVVGVPEGHQFQVMWACVILKQQGQEETMEEDLHENALSKLEEDDKLHHIPDRFFIMDKFPLADGAIDRNVLKKMLISPFMQKSHLPTIVDQRKRSTNLKGTKIINSDEYTISEEKGTLMKKTQRGKFFKEEEVIQRGLLGVVEVSPIETVIQTFPPIKEVVVLGGPQLESRLKYQLINAYVVLKQHHRDVVTEQELHQYAKNIQRSGQMVHRPDNFIILDKLPVTKDGTVDREKLRNLNDDQLSDDTDDSSPESSTEDHSRTGVPLRKRISSFFQRRKNNEETVDNSNMNHLPQSHTDEEQEEELQVCLESVSSLVLVTAAHVGSYQLTWACVILKESQKEHVDEDDLLDQAERAKQRGDIKEIPDRFRILDKIPTGSDGKPDRGKLAKMIRLPYRVEEKKIAIERKAFISTESHREVKGTPMEQSLCSLAAVKEAVVVTVADGKSFQITWACVVLEESMTHVTEDDLHNSASKLHARGTLEETPDRFKILDKFPMRKGRVDTKALRRMLQSPYAVNRFAIQRNETNFSQKLLTNQNSPIKGFTRSMDDAPKSDSANESNKSPKGGGTPTTDDFRVMERTISSLQVVAEAAVVTCGADKFQMTLACVVLKTEYRRDVMELDIYDDLEGTSSGRGQPFCPDKIFILDELPKRRNGSVNKDKLKNMVSAN